MASHGQGRPHPGLSEDEAASIFGHAVKPPE